MITRLFSDTTYIRFVGAVFAFVLTFVLTKVFMKKLPTDKGREYAHDGKLSAGKPRGAGFFFVCVFLVSALLFGELSPERIIYLVLILLCMISGYLDDRAANPWGEYKKGALDLVLAVLVAVNHLYFNGSIIVLRLFNDLEVTLPTWLMGILIVCLVWGSINVTNCADGVDGLSATLTSISLGAFYVLSIFDGDESDYGYFILLFIITLLAYLWFNATPSILLMGDAGSRSMGIVLAIAAIQSRSLLLYLFFVLVIILDGGLGLVKVALLRFLKIHILKNTRTPLHDHVRKNWGWSNTHCVYRFAIIQIMINIIVLFLIRA